MSVAGKRAGLKHEDYGDEETTRSGLFMDQVRIVKEMRANDIRNGRTGESVRPRYMVWENVPGAFSSNKGKDFQAVLEEIIKIVEAEAPLLPMPEKGKWPNAGCIYDEMGKWSLAWRVHDAQYWGVAQRRRRISLLADFAGTTAPWIMFEPEYRRTTEDGYPDETLSDTGAESRSQVQPVGESLPGYSEPGAASREATAGGAGESAESAGGAVEPICLESNQNHATVTDSGIAPTLPAAMGMGGGYVPMVSDSWTIDEKIGQTYIHHDQANTLAARDYKQPQAVVSESKAISFQERAGKPGGGKGILIQEEHVGALSTLTIQHVLSLETYHCESDEDTAMTLKARDYKDPQSVLRVNGDGSDG